LLSFKRNAALWGIAAILCPLSAGQSFAAEFLWLSDIHFDPFADPTLVDKLAAAEPAQWVAILASGSAKFPAFGRDSSWPLVSSTLEASKKTQPNVAFTIVTGDLLAHHFREQFNATATVHDDAAFRGFVHKSMEFTGLQLKRIAPSAPVIIALGNNDDVCGDYFIQPNGPFLRDSAKLVGNFADADAFSATWNASGSYSLPHPTLRKQRIIVLNTVFFSPRYRNSCGDDSADPGENLLAWLAGQLAEAQSRREKVWLVYHIPPGVDAFATTHPKQPSPEGAPALLWKESYTRKFASLMEQYSGVVGPNFAGHIHVDDFRLLGKTAFVMTEPAVSPNIGQNPAFRLVRFNSHGQLTGQSTYYLKNLADAGAGAAADWHLEYRFGAEWRMRGMNAANYRKLYREMGESSETSSRWTLLYSASKPGAGSVTPANFRQFYCAIGNLFAAAYQGCVAAK
jgi:sphingomyelin phosphodiesterase acid-like 3